MALTVRHVVVVITAVLQAISGFFLVSQFHRFCLISCDSCLHSCLRALSLSACSGCFLLSSSFLQALTTFPILLTSHGNTFHFAETTVTPCTRLIVMVSLLTKVCCTLPQFLKPIPESAGSALMTTSLYYLPRRHAHALNDPLCSPLLPRYGPSRNPHLRCQHNSAKTVGRVLCLRSRPIHYATALLPHFDLQ
jgi:hypothetical protein